MAVEGFYDMSIWSRVFNDSHNFSARLKKCHNEKAYLFLIAITIRSFYYKFSWSDAITKSKFEKEYISLTVTTTKTPDRNYIENCVKTVEEKAKKFAIVYEGAKVFAKKMKYKNWKNFRYI